MAPFAGKTLMETTLSGLRGAPVDETIVVVGDDTEELGEVCEPYGVRVVENLDWNAGMSTSVGTGLQVLGPEVRAAVFLLADQPLVGTEAVSRLVEAFEKGADVAVATYDGAPRNPVLFAREVWPLVGRELSGDEGARRFIRQHPELVTEVPCDSVADTADVDTVEDLKDIEERVAGGAAPVRRRS